MFEEKEQAEEYIAFYNMMKKWTPIEFERYGDVFGPDHVRIVFHLRKPDI